MVEAACCLLFEAKHSECSPMLSIGIQQKASERNRRSWVQNTVVCVLNRAVTVLSHGLRSAVVLLPAVNVRRASFGETCSEAYFVVARKIYNDVCMEFELCRVHVWNRTCFATRLSVTLVPDSERMVGLRSHLPDLHNSPPPSRPWSPHLQ